MKNTICAIGGRVHIEPVTGGTCVVLRVIQDNGEAAQIMLDESSGGAVLFAIENSLELQAVARPTVKDPASTVRDCKECAVRGCWARDDTPGVCLDFVPKPVQGRAIPMDQWALMTDAERMAVRSIAP